MADFALAVHAGAGELTRGRVPKAEEAAARRALEAALRAGCEVLARRGGAVDAVVEAVIALEDEPLFNAGRGSVLTAEALVEMDAAVMDGATRAAGGVAAVRRLPNPVRAARLVMERGPHVLLVGEGAERFAAGEGTELVDPTSLVTDARLAQLERARTRARVHLDHDGEPVGGGSGALGTVGAVARDASGHLAAATSTGGMVNQLPGRVGDSPLIGAGTWADDATCAVSGTGRGEAFVRAVFAHEVDAQMRHAGRSLAEACDAALARVSQLGARGGCIAVGRTGAPVMPFTTAGMYRGRADARGHVQVALYGEEAGFDGQR